MNFLSIVERIGDTPTAALFGLIAGVLFGVSAQRSSFCLRAATVEFARGHLGPRMSVWLLTLSTAIVWVQGATALGWMHPADARLMAIPGSWSGAIIGGLIFGVGMVLARGCSGRLLVLAATGNLRAVVSGLVFAVVAQMRMAGWLAPLRDRIAGLWITDGGHNVDLSQALQIPQLGGLVFGLALAALAIFLAIRNQIEFGRMVFASGVGFSVAVAWVLTFGLAQVSFEPFQIQGATFTGFGGMLAGGCAIGAGVTGGSIFVAAAWLALTSMWVGAVIADLMVDQKKCCFWSTSKA